MPLEMAMKAAKAFEETAPAMVPARSARQERNARHYDKRKRLKASESVLNSDASRARVRDITSTSVDNTSEAKASSVRTKGSRLPLDWQASADDIAYAESKGFSAVEIDSQAESFRDWWRSAPGSKGVKADWPATWRTWIRRASENRPRQANDQRPDPRLIAKQDNLDRAFAGAISAAQRRSL